MCAPVDEEGDEVGKAEKLDGVLPNTWWGGGGGGADGSLDTMCFACICKNTFTNIGKHAFIHSHTSHIHSHT